MGKFYDYYASAYWNLAFGTWSYFNDGGSSSVNSGALYYVTGPSNTNGLYQTHYYYAGNAIYALYLYNYTPGGASGSSSTYSSYPFLYVNNGTAYTMSVYWYTSSRNCGAQSADSYNSMNWVVRGNSSGNQFVTNSSWSNGTNYYIKLKYGSNYTLTTGAITAYKCTGSAAANNRSCCSSSNYSSGCCSSGSTSCGCSSGGCSTSMNATGSCCTSARRGSGGCASGCNTSQCLEPDTLILMSNYGSKEVKDIVANDIILSYNETSKQLEPKKVLSKYVSLHSDIVYKLSTKSNDLYITNYHPILTKDGYKDISELTINQDMIFTVNNGFERLKSIVSFICNAPMYNLVIDGSNFIAGNFVVAGEDISTELDLTKLTLDHGIGKL